MNYTGSISEEFKRFFRGGSALSILVILNIGIWLITRVAFVVSFLYNHTDTVYSDNIILHYFGLPASIKVLSAHPWALFTYMFLHLEFWHILFNMLWLYGFGRIFMEYLKSSQLVFTYLAGGLAGGLLYVFAFNVFPVFHNTLQSSLALGASASVMAIVTAISFYVPKYSIQLLFIGRIRILYLAIVLFIFDFIAIPSGNPGGHIAHIGGAAFGYLYSQWMPKTSYSRSSVMVLAGLLRKIRDIFRPRLKVASSNPRSGRAVTDENYNAEKKTKQEQIDKILEKISKGGYDSLSRDEKEFLFRSSGKNSGS